MFNISSFEVLQNDKNAVVDMPNDTAETISRTNNMNEIRSVENEDTCDFEGDSDIYDLTDLMEYDSKVETYRPLCYVDERSENVVKENCDTLVENEEPGMTLVRVP